MKDSNADSTKYRQKTVLKVKRLLNLLIVVIFSLGVLVPPALAQEILPQPDPEFKGKIKVTYETSEADTSILQSPEAPDGKSGSFR
ncbi:MAG: hypothetical protein QNJ64_12945 [Crocosphaera sp.]|nr:hypothetical protein [Crocosphaera sp.]